MTGVPGLWAAGDCAAVPVLDTEKFHPPTAQHGLRQGTRRGEEYRRGGSGPTLKVLRLYDSGTTGDDWTSHGVAMVFGVKFSGFLAWCFWRSVYLMKLPRLPKKLRVMVGWTLDLFFSRDIEQMITLRDVEALSDLAGRIRARETPSATSLALPHQRSDRSPLIGKEVRL